VGVIVAVAKGVGSGVDVLVGVMEGEYVAVDVRRYLLVGVLTIGVSMCVVVLFC
jgi:hypothetical protein